MMTPFWAMVATLAVYVAAALILMPSQGVTGIALASSISIIELLKAGLSEKSLLANPSPLIFVTVLYMVMFIPLTRFSGLLEKRMKAGQRQIRL
jgi:peptidoglycan biosynthesis protein MviN/MurJ (putative lipid II flippase)